MPNDFDWKEARHPGDTIKEILLFHQPSREIGTIKIQQYNKRLYRIASFLPGRDVFVQGDTPKIEPERSQWRTNRATAYHAYLNAITTAQGEGWKEYDPNKFW